MTACVEIICWFLLVLLLRRTGRFDSILMINRKRKEECVGECKVIETNRGTSTKDLYLRISARGIFLPDHIWCGLWNHVNRDLYALCVELIYDSTEKRFTSR